MITDRGGISGLESYDRSTLYYAKREAGGLWSRPLRGGPEVRVTDSLHLAYWGAFAVSEHGIYFLDSDAAPRPAVYYYDFKTARPKLVFSLDRMPLPNNPSITASRDGRTILLAQLERKTHVNLAEASH